MDLYIYYTVNPADATDVARRIGALQRHLASAYDIKSHLKQRLDEPAALETWMEIYNDVPTGFDRVIAQASKEHGIDGLIQGIRHVEYFADLAPCA